MFVLKENRFLKDGISKYEDENNNRLMIIADKTGQKLKIKLRPKNGLKVESIHLEFPFDNEGLNFKIQSSPEDIISSQSEDFISLLHDVIDIAEKWVNISYDLHILTSNEFPLTENQADEIMNSLNEKEEMQAFIGVYKALLNMEEKKGVVNL